MSNRRRGNLREGGVRSEIGQNQQKARFSLTQEQKAGKMGRRWSHKEDNCRPLALISAVAHNDVAGQLVREMRLGMQEPGMYVSRDKAIYWDGRNDVGEPVASGMYVYQLVTPSFQQARRLVIVK